jgi:hypothetical protein
MQPRKLGDLEVGDTCMLASEIQQHTSVSQIYEKIDDTTIRHLKTEETRKLPVDELVYPFEPDHAAHPA